MFAELRSLSDDHFGYAPEEISWCHVGTWSATPSR
jgi:hypothetical protein